MVDWVIIYNDGVNGITTAKSTEITWNDAPNDFVQYLIYVFDNHRKVISGLDVYENNYFNAEKIKDVEKYGFELSQAEWEATREFMIYGDY